MGFVRGTATYIGEVDISADDFWAMLRDWPSVMKWAAKGEGAPAPLADTYLKDGDDVNVLPCTRLCIIDTTGNSHPPVFEETLIHADPEARRLYYTVLGFDPDSVRNYMATTAVDDIGPGRARVTCWSMWDAPTAEAAAQAQAFMESVYSKNIVHGIEAAVKREAAAA